MGEQGEALPRPRHPWAKYLTVLVAVLVAGSAFVILATPSASAASPGPSVQALGPRHEIFFGQTALTVHTLNPYQYTLVDEYYLVGSVYSFLWSYGPNWNVEPDLALRWNQVSANPSIWEFWLTKNAYFVDPRECTKDPTGQHIVDCARTHQVTAADVKFTFDYIKQFGKQTSYFQVCVEKFVRATLDPNDPFYIRLEFEGSYALGFVSAGCLFILPESIWRGRLITDSNVLPIGSGPYLARLDPTDPNKMLTPPPIILDRNPIWYGRETLGRQIFPDTMQFVSYTTNAAMAVDLTLGKIDAILSTDAPTWAGFLSTKPEILRQSVPDGFVAEQAVNVLDDDLRAYFASISSRPVERGHTHPLLREQVVRNAIHMATDRQKMITNAWQGLASPADTLMPPFNQWHLEIPPYSPVDSDGDGLGFDHGLEEFPEGPEGITQAREYLRRAGWRFACATGDPETGVEFPLCRAGRTDPLVFTFHTFNTEPWWEVAARGVVEDAAKAGIQLNMILVNPSAMFNLWYKLDYEVWLWDWVVTPVIDTSLYLTVQTCQGIETLDNDNGFCQRDPVTKRWTFDEKYNQTLTETDYNRRKALSDELWKITYDYASYNLPFYLDQLYAMNQVRWTNWGDWRVLKALPPDIGNPVLIGQHAVAVDQKPPQFSLANVEGASGKPVQFSVAAVDPEGGPLKYRWDFDSSREPSTAPCTPAVNCDGIYDNDEQATTATPTFVYNTPGTYGVALRVSEDGGDFFTMQRAQAKIVLPAVGPPKITAVSFSPSDPTSFTGDEVTFAASANDPNGLALTYTWNFGDGSAPLTTPNPVVGHAYSVAGAYTASLHVVNSDGRPADSSTIVQVDDNVAPEVATLESKVVVVNTDDTFVAFASDKNSRDVLTYTWNFGDGSPVVTGNPVTHKYTQLTGQTPNTITVSVNDGKGHTTTQSASVNVVSDRNTAPKINSLSANPTQTFTGVPVELTATVTDAEGNVLNWEWDFDNNGVVDKQYVTPLVTPGQAQSRIETHPYTASELQAGRATARLTITDQPPSGSPRSTSTSVTIRVSINNAPTLSTISQSPDAILAGTQVTLTSTSSDTDGDRLSYRWEWGDGTSTTGLTGLFGGPIEGIHTYAEDGEKSVALIVSDGKGGEARRGFIVNVLFQQIQAVIETQWTQLYLGQTIDLRVVAKVAPNIGASGAAVTLSGSPGLTLGATSGVLDPDGKFTTTVRGAALGAESVSVTVSKAPHTDGTDVSSINVISPLSMTMALASDTIEMMYYETATVRVTLTSGGTGVTDAIVTGSSRLGGNFSAVKELGGGRYEFKWDAPKVTVQTFARIDVRTKVGGYTDATGFVSPLILVDPNKTDPLGLTQLFLIVQPEKSVLRSGETINVTVFVYTIEGFVVRGANMTLLMRIIIGTLGRVVDRLNGVYTFTYTAPVVTLSTGVTIRIDASKFGYNAGRTNLGLLIVP